MPHHVIAFFLMPSIKLVIGRLALMQQHLRTPHRGHHQA